MKISMNGHQITSEQIIRVTAWDKEVKGYAGVVEYKTESGRCMPYITKKELASLKEMGFVPEVIQALKYSGTY